LKNIIRESVENALGNYDKGSIKNQCIIGKNINLKTLSAPFLLIQKNIF
jgi:hypothetical protein